MNPDYREDHEVPGVPFKWSGTVSDDTIREIFQILQRGGVFTRLAPKPADPAELRLLDAFGAWEVECEEQAYSVIVMNGNVVVTGTG